MSAASRSLFAAGLTCGPFSPQTRGPRAKRFGRIIHEFDPWFNMRATTYLARNGLQKFFTWFDHESWYPIGRPVGTTIYPGLQIVAVALWRTLKYFGYAATACGGC